jgi:protein-arginine kinase activator protein McsA
MINNKEVRLDQKQDSSFNIALESFIQDKINSTKKSAVEEMEDELQKCVESEDYENAAEYRDMIKEYKNK